MHLYHVGVRGGVFFVCTTNAHTGDTHTPTKSQRNSAVIACKHAKLASTNAFVFESTLFELNECTLEPQLKCYELAIL